MMRKYNLTATRKAIWELLWIINPDGVKQRKAKRLLSRQYLAPGPNYIWHIDGYNKLKPFRFCIHASIDGFSRKILWLEVGRTNNDPTVIVKCYLDALTQFKYAPRILRCDQGTENSLLKLIQPYFRYDCNDAFAGLNSIMFGKSTSNQRIEAWWSILRRQGADWWIQYFKDMRDCGEFRDNDPVHIECIRFCFMGILQSELHQVVRECNLHFIHCRKNAESPEGKPDIIFHNPLQFGTTDYGTSVV